MSIQNLFAFIPPREQRKREEALKNRIFPGGAGEKIDCNWISRPAGRETLRGFSGCAPVGGKSEASMTGKPWRGQDLQVLLCAVLWKGFVCYEIMGWTVSEGDR